MNKSNDYGEIFRNILRSEFNDQQPPFDFLEKIKYLSDEKLQSYFPGKSKLWLTKEISKWKGKILHENEKGTFNPTLNNLNLFCLLTGASPNDVLCNTNNSDYIQFISYEALEQLSDYLRSQNDIPQSYTIPVLYAPEKMASILLTIYSNKVNNKTSIYLKASTVTLDGWFECGQEINICEPHKNQYSIKMLYEKMIHDFREAINDINTIIFEEFYPNFNEWAIKLDSKDNKLTAWFPVVKNSDIPKLKPSLDEQTATSEKMRNSYSNEPNSR